MRITVPDYYDQFHCLAGGCPHSCCEKWEVVLDEASVHLYESISGSLGEKLRGAMTEDEDGDICFLLNGGRCPFLDRENLCEIHRQLGEHATSVTCQEHPRFTEDYGSFREITLSASCPAANALLLGSENSLAFVNFETDEAEEGGDAWLEYLLPFRERLLAVLADRTRPLRARLKRFLLLAFGAQICLDEERIEDIGELAEKEEAFAFAEGEEPLFPRALQVLGELEILESNWRDLLQQAGTAGRISVSECLLERIAVYFAFRYLLKCVNDGDLLGRAQLCVLAILVVERVAAVCGLEEALRRFSCEIEHNNENLEELLWRFQQDETMGIGTMLRELTA